MNAFAGATLRHVRHLLSLATLACAAATPAVWSQSFPDKPITLIVPFAAGGPTDVTARLFAKEIGSELGQTVVVDNRPGAGGLMGGGIAARSKADGYTLLWGGTSTMAVAPSLYSNLPYDPLTSFSPVSRAVRGPLVLAVNSKLPAKTLGELIALAKSRPGTLNFGSAGVGSIIHLTGEMFRSRVGIDITHIPYKGNAEVMTDLSGGTLQMAFVALGHMLPHMKDGSVRALAITSPERNPLVPDVPTVAESGYPGFESMEWFGLLAPAGTPGDVTDKLNLAFRHASQKQGLRDSVAKLGYLPVDETPMQFTAAIKEERSKWREVVTKANVRVE